MSINTSQSSSHIPNEKTATPSWIQQMQIPDHNNARGIFYETSDENSAFGVFTLLDLFGTEEFSPIALREKIFQLIGTKDTPGHAKFAIGKVNNLYSEALIFLESILLRQIPLGLKERKWENIADFVSTIGSHTNRQNNGAYSLMFCAIIKIMFIETGLDSDPNIDELDADMMLLLKKIKELPGLKFKRNGVARIGDYVDYELDGLHAGKMENRPKSRNSIKTKMVYNRKYNKLDKFKDLLALRFELDPSKGETGYVHTILKIKAHLYGESDVVFEIKGNILSPHSIETLRQNGISVTIKTSKGAGSLQYEDAKFVAGAVKIPGGSGKKTRNLHPEIQFVLPNNKNEAGFSNHEVYELKKILSANVRLFGAITLGNLGYILAHSETGFDKRSLLNHLLYPQDGKTKPFLYILQAKSKTTGKIKTYLSTSDVYEESINKRIVSLSNIYPDFPGVKNKGGSTLGNIQELVHATVDGILKKPL